jgi:TetR/AcrR family transcriptional regulator, transcriptional repressor for nem operon
MRRSKEQAAETRRHIVNTAAAEFRRQGIAETGLSDLMAAAGLTHGGFYRHFGSKDQLVAEACSVAVDSTAKAMESEVAGKSPELGLHAVLAKYLQPAHRERPANGCVIAALGSELRRSDKKTREVATAGYVRLVKIIARQITGVPEEEAERRATAIVSAMVGAITISRFVLDKETSDQVLRDTKEYLLRWIPAGEK